MSLCHLCGQHVSAFYHQGLSVSGMLSTYRNVPDSLVDYYGIKRAKGDSLSLRLPVMDDLMVVVFRALDLSLADHCMFWAACNLAYCGFRHSEESQFLI